MLIMSKCDDAPVVVLMPSIGDLLSNPLFLCHVVCLQPLQPSERSQVRMAIRGVYYLHLADLLT